jgi:hypothetical protein
MALPKRSASRSTTATRLVVAQTRSFRAASLFSQLLVLTPTRRTSPAHWNGSLLSGPANQMPGLTLGICSLSLTGSPTTTCNGFTEILWPVSRLVTCAQSIDANSPIRCHHWCGRCTTKYGIRNPRGTSTAVWSLFVFHGCPALLVLRHFEGHHHRRKS